MEYTYHRNIDLINLLYNSDFAKSLKIENANNSIAMLRSVIDSFYKDPDVYDIEKIYDKSTLKSTIQLGLDGLCGWKVLFDIYDGDSKWLEDYKTIRGSKLGYLLWPNSTDGRKHPTINQLKYTVFGDRIDYTLYDINLFLDKKKRDECRLSGAYQGETNTFFEKYESINDFIEDNNKLLSVFLNEEKEVVNILTGNPIKSNEHKKFQFSIRWGVKNNKEEWKLYIKKIVELCEKAEKLES
ncbi:MAG TPA: hypothetical protein VGC17_07710 [Lactovum miscens]|uniref:DUF6994 family protein n=1 Tax=Lactovum miscens TaxID=190387 RepID=UPI002ED9C8A2